MGDLGPIPRLGRYPVGGHSNPLQYSGLDTPHGQRSLVGYSPWSPKVLDMTEQLSSLCSLTRLIFFLKRRGIFSPHFSLTSREQIFYYVHGFVISKCPYFSHILWTYASETDV